MYTEQELAELSAAAPRYEAASRRAYAALVEPTPKTRAKAVRAALDVARSLGRKVYGGYALNARAWDAHRPAAFYGDPASDEDVGYDVEFYSPDPFNDARRVCDALHALGMKRVQAKEAMHAGTIAVTAHFARVCDITYAPPAVFKAIPASPCATDDALLIVAAEHLRIDILSQIADPVRSHWRLATVLERAAVLGRVLGRAQEAPSAIAAPAQAPRAPAPIESPSTVWVGANALAGVLPGGVSDRLARAAAALLDEAGPEALSVDFDADVARISATMRAPVAMYHPLMGVLGRRATWGRRAVSIFDHRGRPVPVVGGPQPALPLTASFAMVLMHARARAFEARVCGRRAAEAAQEAFADALEAERAAFPGTASCADCACRDLGLAAIGRCECPMEHHMAWLESRGRPWFRYAPRAAPSQHIAIPPHLHFPPRDGAHVKIAAAPKK
jgi:hypothetical protein